jgi:site-specific DNA-methyltransferase (adenine-specific)
MGGIVQPPDVAEFGIVNIDGREPPVAEKFAKHRAISTLRPFMTSHQVVLGDARRLSTVKDESVHLVVTSPPYFDLVTYREGEGQLGHIHDYVRFLDEMDKVWRECYRVLIPGGRLCCVIGDVCRSRKRHGRHEVIPLHADLLTRLRALGFEGLATIFWHKIANATTEIGGAGAALGKPYEPNGVVKNDVEFILRLRKPGPYRKPTPLQRAASLIPPKDYAAAMRQIWADIPGAPRREHPAPFPTTLAARLIRISSYVEDTVLDPFLGTGTTTQAAIETDRNSIGYEISSEYIELVKRRFSGFHFHHAISYLRACEPPAADAPSPKKSHTA